MSDLDPLKEDLIQNDEAFRRLHEEHQEYEQRLDAINAKSLRSPEDEIEEKRIKLHKLRLKDEMASILRQQTRAAAV
ncbi:MAG: YdcH family protein [Acidobacteriota bacterium]